MNSTEKYAFFENIFLLAYIDDKDKNDELLFT